MLTIVVGCLKGGVTKTTTTLCLAAAIAETGLRVGIWDADPQASATRTLGLAPVAEDPCTAAPVPLAFDGIPVGSVTVVRGSRRLVAKGARPVEDFVAREDVDVDVAIIDTGPGHLDVFVAACSVADIVIVPVDSSPDGYDGMVDVMDVVSHFPDPLPVRALLTRYRSARNMSGQIAELVEKRYPGLLLETIVPEDASMDKARVAQRPVVLHIPGCRAARAYREAAAEVMALLPQPSGSAA